MLRTHNGSSTTKAYSFRVPQRLDEIRKSKTLDHAEAPNGFLWTTLKFSAGQAFLASKMEQQETRHEFPH